MDDPDEANPIVPHNSVVDCRLHASPTGTTGFSRRERRDDFALRQSQPLKRDITDGRAAIDSLKSRLYDRPENSEVFRAILRPVPPSLGQSAQVAPHPPSKSGPRSTMGNYRTTLFRRDFNRLQAQRNQGFPKEPVSIKQGTTQLEKETIPRPSETVELDSQQLAFSNGAAPLERGAAVSDGMANVNLEQMSAFSDDGRQAPSVGSLGKTTDESSSFVSSEASLSRPNSHKSRVSSARSVPAPSRSQRPDVNGNVAKRFPQSIPADDDDFIGLDVADVIKKLRERLNMSTDLDAIANGEDPDEDENNIQRLYIREDDGKFLYCLPKSRGVRGARYNPYDLICVMSQEAQSATQYFTITASAVTQVRDGFDSDLTPLKRWLYERKMFNIIFGVPTFAKFRLWKGYTCWRNNVRFQKNCSSRSEVHSSLFSATKASQEAILLVRSLCEKACSSITGVGEKEHAIGLLYTDHHTTFTLKDFLEAQARQAEEAKEKLAKLRAKVLEIVKEACEKITEEEGLTEWVHPERKKEPAKKKRTTKPDGKKRKGKDGDGQPTFTQMSQWRGILHRLTCFIRMIDFLIMELLRRLVLVALRTLLAQVKSSSMQGPIVHLSLMEPTLDGDEKSDAVLLGADDEEDAKAVELLKVELVLNVPPKEEGVDRKTVTFDVNSTPRPDTEGQTTPYTGEGTFADDAMTVSSDVEPSVMSSGSYSVHGSKSFISLKPTEQDFETALLSIIYGFEQTAASFKSLVHDPQLSIYVTPPASDVVYALSRDVEEEEKTKKILWPDSELLFGQDPDYQNDVGQIFHQIKEEVDNVLNYSKKFRKFCGMVDKSRRVDVDGSLKEREWNTEEFYAVLNQHTEEVLDMKKMTLHKRVGLFHVDITGFQKDCLPFPEKVLEAVGRHLPVIAAKRNDVLLNVIKHASRKLDKMPETVEAFVEHLIFLSRMANEIASLEQEYNIVTRMYSIARNFDMTISAEELALYQTLMPSFQHLKSTILYCEAKKDENIQRYSRALDDLIGSVRRELVVIKNKVCSPALLDADSIPQVATEKLKLLKEDLANLSTKARNYATYQERFGSSMSSSLQKKALTEGAVLSKAGHSSPQATSLQSEVTEVEKDLTLRCLLWESLQEWQGLVDQWEATPFETLKIDDVQQDVTRFIQTVFLLEKGLPPNKVVPRLKQKVTSFKQGMPVITSLRNAALRTRHWEAIQNVIGTRIVRDKYFTLGHLLQLQVFQHKDKISDISSQASNEATLEQMLQKVMDFWNHTDFTLSAHASRDIAIITGADDIITAVEESQVTLSNIRGSRFVTPIKALVEDWDRKLKLFARTLDEWLLCQRNWLYLETIFSAADIQSFAPYPQYDGCLGARGGLCQGFHGYVLVPEEFANSIPTTMLHLSPKLISGQLPNEARLFAQVDKSWKDIMRRTIDKPNAIRAATAAGVLEVLQASNSHLEKIHRCLEDYLETKRLVFARFYFLSNEDLLDILANSKNPNAVQPHLRKCFGNIHQLGIVRQAHSPAQIQTMTSEEGESVQLPKTLRARGTVESWLYNVELAMYETIKMHLKKCLVEYGTVDYSEWVLGHPGQAVLTVSQIVFNRDVLNCFHTTRPKESLQSKREKLVTVLHSLSQMVTSALVPHQHQTLEALLTIDVHARDVLDSMINNQVYQQEDFQWTRQLRYEWNDDRHACLVRHSNAVFEYGYEYLGCSPRLVITPLTDRCYLTLTGALNLHLNGAPAGPAGTGKTETVKDLAKAMGKQCLVFNCSEGLDYKMMGKFFSGLAQSGSWFCFDEFNRIDVEVLSVIAQQLHTIKTAKDNAVTRFLFEGRDIKLNPNCGMFITMNPGYAGRVELPDNLKSLFRPVAMMVPDYALIAEIILFSEGFTAAAQLSRKVVNLYQLASKQLSQQDHYDFGLRAIKSVLLMAGQRRRAASLNMESESLEEEESHLIINAVKDANIPKFVAEDVPLFKSLLADLFPGSDPPGPDNKLLKKAAKTALGELSIQYWPTQIDKVIQLNSTLQVRHGVMLVGPAGGGKTTTRQILKRALVVLPTIQAREQQQQQLGPGEEPDETGSSKTALSYLRAVKARRGSVHVSTLNPKCVTVGELYGEVNSTTMEWKDGLLSHIYRKYAKDSRGVIRGARRKQSNVSPANAPNTPRLSRTSSAKSVGTSVSAISIEDTSEVETVAATEEGSGINKEETPVYWHWIVMDGPVDTLWIENLNTVLDDTKVLCLANGERIGMGHGMRILFEVDNLAMASPATVSRCGMVYMEPTDLGWRPYVKTWIQRVKEQTKFPPEAFSHLLQLFEHSIDIGLRFISTYNKLQYITAPNLSIVSTLCSIISGFIEILNNQGGLPVSVNPNTAEEGAELSETTSAKTVTFADESEQEVRPRRLSFIQRDPSQLLSFLGKLFVFAFTWSFGGNLRSRDLVEDEDMGDSFAKGAPPVWQLFDTLVRELFEIDTPIGVKLPPGNDSIANYYIDMENGQFVLWSNLVPTTRALIAKAVSNQFAISDTFNTLDDPPPLKNQIDVDRSLVPTVDTVRYAFLIALMALNGQPVLLTGETGVGKSALIQDTLVRLSQAGGTGTSTGTILGAVFRTGGKNLVDSIIDITMGDREGGKVEGCDSEVVSNSMHFSAYTSSAKARKFIESKLVKRGRDVLGPRPGKKVLLFVDDLNMPQPDPYQSQPPLELLRQFLDARGFYDSNKLQWKEVHDVTLLAACAPPGGGRSAINDRLLRHFSVLCLPHPSHKWLYHIYTTQLGRFLEKVDFTPEVRDSCQDLVTTAMGLYFNLSANLLPTPAKSHYTFNLRDLNKVIEGLLQAHPTVITSRDHCCQLLGHEASRVLHDRLTNDADRRYFYQVLSDQLHNGFKARWSPEELEKTPLIFGDFLEGSSPHGPRAYRFVRQYDRLPQILEEYYDRTNLSGSSVEHRFVFFDMAIQHVTRAARVFRQPGKHMHMVGVGGTGKATVAKLAAFIEDCVFLRPFVSRTYNLLEFRDDLKKASLRAGVKGDNTVLFLTDNLVKDDFLEDVTSILSGGEIASLFDHEDLERISLDLKREAIHQGIQDTKEAIFQFFIQRVRKKLHVVLSTTPAGTSFRRRCRLYPPLINCCTIDWFDKWPLDALQSVAMSFLETSGLAEDQESNSALMASVSKVFVEVYRSVEEETQKFYDELHRRYYTTPTSYMEFVRLYLSKLNEKRAEFSFNRDRLCIGLQKLSESNSLVGTMQTELLQLGPKLEQKAKDTEKLLEQLASDQEAVDQVHSVVQKEEEIMNEEAMRVQAIAEEAQRDLEGALPQLEAAIVALDSLDKSDISEIRVYTKPPTMVMTVLSAVCVLLQQKPDWNSAKLLLGDQGFLKKLVSYDKNSVPDKVFTRLKRYTQHPEFNPEAVGKISVACKSMCQWVLALENYAEVYKIVQPKQKRCEEAQAALAIAKENLQQKQTSLLKIQEQLQLLQQQYDDSVAQLEELRQKKKLTIIRLQRASILTASLAEEQVRWTKSVNSQEEHAQGLIGDTLVSSAAVAYLGAFTSSYRNRLLSHWLELCRKENIPVSENFELTDFLSEPIEIQKWLNKGLPHDKHSIENAVLMKHCRRWPLLIDPQEQASHWITQTEKGNGLKIVKASDPSYIRTLESAIPLGQPVLVEDVSENLDPSLNPILSKNTIQRGNQAIILIGETEIEYNSNFRLYMTTPLANPHFLPEVCIKVTVINFTVTLDGLQDQLLSRVVQKERPKLEESRKELLQGLVTDRYKLRELEDRSLSLLHSSRGNILDDEDLITTLDDSKKMADVIHTRVVESEETEEKINLSREKYLPVATRGAVLYFVLTDLAYVDVMYQFSLPWFTDLFESCIESAQEPAQALRSESPIAPGSAGTLRPIRKDKAAVSTVSRPGYKRRQTISRPKDANALPEYLQALVELLTESVYRVVSYALFARHKLTFSFMLCAGIMRHAMVRSHDAAIKEEEWNWFLRGSAVAAITDRLENEEDSDRVSLPSSRAASHTKATGSMGQFMSKMNKSPVKWINESTWKECLQLSSSIPAFAGLCSNIAVNGAFWSKFVTSENPFKFLEDDHVDTKDSSTALEGKDSHSSQRGWHATALTRFQRLIIVKVLRPERLVDSVRLFVEEQMGSKFITSVGFDLQEIYEESNNRKPLIFILSPGSDPTSQLMRFAREIRGTSLHLDMISLGRGQGPRAEEAITKAYQQKGKWVFLQNCHYAASFMPRLQMIVRRISHPETIVDPNFRMWLSSKPDPSFPVSILQAGLKMTVEPPPGIKANLLRSFGGVGGVVTESVWEDSGPGPAWKRLLFGLCFFNAVVHERKKFGALGWNIPYEFTASDLEVSILMLHMLLTEHHEVPWKAIKYLTGDIAYGGRVTDNWDQRCLQSILGKFYSPKALQESYGYTVDYVYRPPPPEISLSVCCEYIESLPAVDAPELFGMDHNADTAFLANQGRALIGDLLAAQPRLTATAVGSNKPNDDIVLELVSDTLKYLPQRVDSTSDGVTAGPIDPRFRSFTPDPLKQMTQKKLSQDPLVDNPDQSVYVTVLRQEINRFDRLLAIIHSSLSALRLAVKGEVLMSEQLDEAYNALLSNRVPKAWEQVAYESCKPLGAWVDNLAKRVDFFNGWLDLVTTNKTSKSRMSRESGLTSSPSTSQSSMSVSAPRDYPNAFWLPAFFFPQGFLTAVLQTHARDRKVPVDSLSFSYRVLSEKWTSEELLHSESTVDFKRVAFQGTPPEEGSVIFGLYLDGASWDFSLGCLQDSLSGQRFYPLPELHVTPIQQNSSPPSDTKGKQDKDEEELHMYDCPLYRTSLRASSLTSAGHTTNYVTAVNLPSVQPADYWITRGVALLCQLDE